MSLEKIGYKGANQGTTKVKVAADEHGYIAGAGTVAVGTRTISITKAAAENSLADNTEVLDFFLTLANGCQDSLTNTMSVTWAAANTGE